MTAAAPAKHTKAQHRKQHHSHEKESDTPIEIVMSSTNTTNKGDNPTKRAPVVTNTGQQDLTHALELEEEWAGTHDAHMLAEDVRPLQPATHSPHRNKPKIVEAKRKESNMFELPYPTEQAPPATALHSFKTFVDHIIDASAVHRWALRVDRVPIRAEAHAAVLGRLRHLLDMNVWNNLAYFPKLVFLGGSRADVPPWTVHRVVASLDLAVVLMEHTFPAQRLLPLDWFLDEEDVQHWRGKTQEEREEGLPQRLATLHTAEARLEELKMMRSCEKDPEAWGRRDMNYLDGLVATAEEAVQKLKDEAESPGEPTPHNEWVQWMYNGAHGTKQERKQQHKQHKETGPKTLKGVDPRLRTCRKVLMCADCFCWRPPVKTQGYAHHQNPRYTPGGGEPVITPPSWAQQVQDAKDKQTHHSGFKDHHAPLPPGVADLRSMKNTYEFVVPLCVISIPDDFETQRLNLMREWYPERCGWPGRQSAPPVPETEHTPPTVFADTPESLPDNAQEESEEMPTEIAHSHKHDKHAGKKKTQARKWARDAKTGVL
eukprot:TRINITY_DN67602_c10_g4_i1.p1 TRINITY_DN67602_c10_g4~~TRINITY_DN67602_c10_g4_i1.p1  ORF type:complete len:624 (-),score=61.38 TRINITY_DN67602_c10_g4_i1:123-1751(-)